MLSHLNIIGEREREREREHNNDVINASFALLIAPQVAKWKEKSPLIDSNVL
jgi:hypothetical protein